MGSTWTPKGEEDDQETEGVEAPVAYSERTEPYSRQRVPEELLAQRAHLELDVHNDPGCPHLRSLARPTPPAKRPAQGVEEARHETLCGERPKVGKVAQQDQAEREDEDDERGRRRRPTECVDPG
jgi:hypothetical protein